MLKVVSYGGGVQSTALLVMAALGFGVIAPHDLRRTFAKLAYRGGAQLDQISMSLGHESIETTQKYLGIEQSFTDAPCDHLGLSLG